MLKWSSLTAEKKSLLRLGASFFLFGLINNVLYVIILSAALDLVPPSTPKGIIAFCNIAPALAAKIGWPYLLKGKIQYARRVIGCCLLSFVGMLVVALYESLYARLLGICLASFSSGLGELTFLQLSTTYSPPSVGGHSVGYFASGTGGAGLVGAFLWWEVRGWGVRTGVGISSVLPFILPLTYYLLLPRPATFLHPGMSRTYSTATVPEAIEEEGDGVETSRLLGTEPSGAATSRLEKSVSLSATDKWRLVKPMLMKYMLPLFCVYTFEYTINQGVAPTLLYPVPDPSRYWLLSKIIHSVRDYYPLWQLVYQASVFLSRSSISFGLPPIPERLLPAPAFVQLGILFVLVIESALGIFSEDREGRSFALVFLLIGIEGICGGLAYVNVFYRINQEEPDRSTVHNLEQAKQEREFRIGSIGFADSSGILLASLLAVPTELELCKTQVSRGKTLCKGL
ncbi:batten's disease protein Cln3 [Coniophora puteana RWD-64-598 SS2]|uniref:Protein BTN n=1 Tax=Coniophora puteana (strain RWD-64-598) TaxID=741705 RepID=A0A5M3MK98_CONPW|nr:batten's disease protein Cln3 [Coniophora puteana RWD-64-598 SS2]EIW79659.1 batten's disease protein Cln3 [Coniophora puteana RWD-64-598 SS2]